jgi:threonine/homoserine/homoserine lactone efflux protein
VSDRRQRKRDDLRVQDGHEEPEADRDQRHCPEASPLVRSRRVVRAGVWTHRAIYHGYAARHMVPTAHLLTFAVAACALIVVPGPSVLFVIGRAVALGRRAGLATVVGNAAGEYLQLVLVAIGVGALIERSAVVFTVLKLVGAGYVVFLGVRAIRCRRELAGVLDGTVVPEGDRRILREGFVVGATNPKTAAFFGAVLPQFVEPAAGNVALQLLALGVIWVAIALVSDGAWAYLAGAARHWLARSPRRLELVGGAEGS